MVLTRKGISASSEAIIKEQRQITREKLLASPAPMAQTSVFKVVIAVVKNPICETKITDFAYFVVLRRIPKRKEACFVIFTSPLSLRLWYLLS